MLERIPPALLAVRIGGHLTPARMRKQNFLKFALPFLKSIIQEIGMIAGEGSFSVNPLGDYQSGKATFESPTLYLELAEDEVKQDGIRLTHRIRTPEGQLIESGWAPLAVLKKDNELAVFLYKLAKRLAEEKAQIQ